jgi:hypothetical protein
MLTKTKIALAAVLMLGTASTAALARGSYGGPTQSWADIARDQQDIQSKIQRLYHTDNAGAAYGYAPAHASNAR